MTDKFCKDCTYCQIVIGELDGIDYSKCYHPDAAQKREISLVTGQLPPLNPPYASIVRKHECGIEGKLFEGRKEKWIATCTKEMTQGISTTALTRDNCYEHGFRYDEISRRFL